MGLNRELSDSAIRFIGGDERNVYKDMNEVLMFK